MSGNKIDVLLWDKLKIVFQNHDLSESCLDHTIHPHYENQSLYISENHRERLVSISWTRPVFWHRYSIIEWYDFIWYYDIDEYNHTIYMKI